MLKLAIGIDIGGTRTKIGLVDLLKGEVLETLIAPTEKTDALQFLAHIGSATDTFKKKASALGAIIRGIGVGVPSFVFDNGLVDSTYGFLEFMEDYPLVSLIEERCSLPCRADNDARAVALGEALYGKGKGYSRVLVLTLGTGLGLGFTVDRKFQDKLPYAHMGGHMRIGSKGISCYCGKQDCLESLVSGTGLREAAIRMDWEKKYPHLPLNVETIFQSEQQGNPDAARLVADFLAYLKIGIDNYINLFAPDIIIIGGGVGKGMSPYLPQLSFTDFLKPYKSYLVTIALSELEEHAGILGSAALFHDTNHKNI
ncbi:ROK family protein [Catalinimonas niigatensis]|uniref:ROK family protein n=1 Tax=Catalinimonas niigatensis TaxID=1397264 RepID=UPI002665EC24|nr:ROK family protein [Catalinimonas niigatensis]WPP50541.1 ROK family protein [Catalinimonas niigatensis]